MEVMDSPLNRAHLYGRKADRLVTKGKYEEAILCHGEAAELLNEALLMTHCKQVRLSLALQRDRHIQQQRLIKGRTMVSSPASVALRMDLTIMSSQTVLQDEAQPPPLGWKTAKDDKTRLEEQSTSIADLWKLVALLLKENEQLLEEHEKLWMENARLKKDLYEEHQSRLPSFAEPAQMLSPLGVNLQEKIRLLWERANGSYM
ncbi:nuclear receptor-binding factor 2-like [Misgurnus anguillicaudatus]|uniref:nuclear receptor-binding factor 2-like n=1 Tax=Misgurnus anguillicaudatus TaxID=75329 RepID=UPI003CCF61FF